MTRAATPPSCIAISRRRCSMARRRASMREGPLAELFRATEAAQRQAEKEGRTDEAEAPNPAEPPEQTVEHVPEWVQEAQPAPPPEPVQLPERTPPPEPKPEPKREPERARIEPLPEPPPRLHRVPEPGAYIAVIRVVGVGAAGLNAVNRMIDADSSQVELVAVHPDIQ